MLNEFFNRPVGSLFNKDDIPFNVPAVNIREDDKAFYLSIAAPGLDKKDFNVEVDQGNLVISVDKEEEKKEDEAKYTRREFSYYKFKHSFSLPEDVDSNKITAEYKNGVLEVTLPRKATKVLKSKSISVK